MRKRKYNQKSIRENIKYLFLSIVLITIAVIIFKVYKSKENIIVADYYPETDTKVNISVGRIYETDGYIHTCIYPDNIDDTFVVDILLPDNYDEDKSYPVVYLTDCYWKREDYPAIKALYESGKTEEFILVGIGYPDDYDFGLIRNRDLIFHPHDFLRLIVEGILPYVESVYSIDADNRSFLGSSCGGYFMLYSLFQSDDLTKDVFKNYIVNSPVFYYYGNVKVPPYTLEEDYFLRNGNTLDAYVYMTVGGIESEENFKRPLKELADTMLSRNYNGLTLDYEVYEGLGHNDVWVPTLLEGLSRCLAK
ncbi:MAG TPA: alpha/beta hydrolase-fold protein [Lachnospiraceae bacterium]|nr:alpha/beta hydrolase-fold protein [Lachnospiraceae bacterium]